MKIGHTPHACGYLHLTNKTVQVWDLTTGQPLAMFAQLSLMRSLLWRSRLGVSWSLGLGGRWPCCAGGQGG